MASEELRPKINNFVSRSRATAPQLLDLLSDIDGLVDEWFANSYNSSGANEITDDDMVGDNAALSAADLQDLIFTYDTLKNALDGAHRSNLWIANP